MTDFFQEEPRRLFEDGEAVETSAQQHIGKQGGEAR